MGISSAILRFSQRVVPIGQVPSGGSAETGRASPSPASIAAVTVFTKSGAASETTGGRLVKGQMPEDEIALLPEEYQVESVVKLQVPALDGERHLVVIKANKI